MARETNVTTAERDPPDVPERRSQGSLAGHSVNYMISSTLAVIGGAILLPVYTHTLSTAEYGLLETALRFVGICMVVGFLGIRQAYARIFFEQESTQGRRALTTTTVAANALITVFMVFPLVLVGSVVARHYGFDQLTVWRSVGLTLWVGFEATFLVGLTALQVRLRSRAFILAQGLRVTLLVSVMFTSLKVLHLGFDGALMGNVLVAMVSGAISALLLVREGGRQFSGAGFRDMVNFSLPYIPTAALSYVVGNADRFMVISIGSVASLGLLAFASKITEIGLSVFSAPVDNVWAPFAFGVCHEADGPTKIGRLYTRFAAIYILLAVGVSLASPIVIKLLASEVYEPAADLVPIVAMGWLFGVLGTMSDIGILIAKRTRWKPVLVGVCAACAIALQLVLTPRFGIVGAAVASTLTNIIGFSLVRTFSNRFYRLVLNKGHFLAMTLAACVAFLLGREVERVVPSLWGDVLGSAVGSAIYLVVIIRAQIVSVDDLWDYAERTGVLRLMGPLGKRRA